MVEKTKIINLILIRLKIDIMYSIKYQYTLLSFLSFATLFGQFNTGAGKPTVAILDFEGRGIFQLKTTTLTNRFSSMLGYNKVPEQYELSTFKQTILCLK